MLQCLAGSAASVFGMLLGFSFMNGCEIGLHGMAYRFLKLLVDRWKLDFAGVNLSFRGFKGCGFSPSLRLCDSPECPVRPLKPEPTDP